MTTYTIGGESLRPQSQKDDTSMPKTQSTFAQSNFLAREAEYVPPEVFHSALVFPDLGFQFYLGENAGKAVLCEDRLFTSEYPSGRRGTERTSVLSRGRLWVKLSNVYSLKGICGLSRYSAQSYNDIDRALESGSAVETRAWYVGRRSTRKINK